MATLYNPTSNPMLRWNDFKPKPLPKDKTTTKTETYITPGATLKSTNRADYVNEVLKKYETRQPIYREWGDGHIQDGWQTVYNLGTTGHWDGATTTFGNRTQAEKFYADQINKLYQEALDFNKLHTHTRTWKETIYADQASVILENARNEAAYKQGLMNEWKQFEAMQIARSQAGRGTRLYWSEEFDSKTGQRLVPETQAQKTQPKPASYSGAPSSNEEFIDPTSTTQMNSLLSEDAPVSPILTNNQQQRKRQQLLAS